MLFDKRMEWLPMCGVINDWFMSCQPTLKQQKRRHAIEKKRTEVQLQYLYQGIHTSIINTWGVLTGQTSIELTTS